MAKFDSIPEFTEDEIRRFWAKVEKGPGCWNWTAAKHGSGYGSFGFRGELEGAHRISVVLSGRTIAPGMWVCHHCDNHACVRPDHLFIGTPGENSRDMIAKGRARFNGPNKPRGERHHRAKITAADVSAIREAYQRGEARKAIAERHGISVTHVRFVATGLSWRHVA